MTIQPNRLAADAAHSFGGIAIDRDKPLTFRLDGRDMHGFAGDTILSALLASGMVGAGTDTGSLLALDERFHPPVALRSDPRLALPMDRTPVLEGFDLITLGLKSRQPFLDRLFRRPVTSLGQVFDNEPHAYPWMRQAADETIDADLVIVGGGAAGLSAAETAGKAGKRVVLVERRPWLGGDARYYGALGNDETPEALTERLAASIGAMPNITLLASTEAFDIAAGSILAHRVTLENNNPRATVLAIAASSIVLATGAMQRLPLFAGNRLPGVVGSIAAYHRAKRYGVWIGKHALFASQSNFGYRLAMRIHDAGVAVARIIDPRVNPQSRFVDFSKASGFTLSSGLVPSAIARDAAGGLAVTIVGSGGAAQTVSIGPGQFTVSGAMQPDLTLWMRAGGAIRWNTTKAGLEPAGHLSHIALAGSAAGVITLKACAASGRAAAAQFYGLPAVEVDDTRIDALYETPDGTTPIAPSSAGRTYLDAGLSLITRNAPPTDATGTRVSPVDDARPMSLGDVAAAVEAQLIEPADAGVIADERGTAGGAIPVSDWRPVAVPDLRVIPDYLRGRFGDDALVAHVVVDNVRKLEIGALVYSNTASEDPRNALGVIMARPPEGKVGALALFSRTQLGRHDRLVVRTYNGAAPLRIAERLEEARKVATIPAA
ncbi:MAG: FAD-dependent oxidoreductase [Devosia sp.]